MARTGSTRARATSHSALPGPALCGGASVHTCTRGRGAPRLPHSHRSSWVARPLPRCGRAAQARPRRWRAPTPPRLSRGRGPLPGQVRGVSGQRHQEPTAAQRPRRTVGPAATPCRGPPAARPDSRARPRPARRSRAGLPGQHLGAGRPHPRRARIPPPPPPAPPPARPGPWPAAREAARARRPEPAPPAPIGSPKARRPYA